ncbi:MAG TPA: trehalose-phosphatase [Sphingomicrobium sp.]|nr:trehalose-phosphatase [Sphingomicrobium sp.]
MQLESPATTILRNASLFLDFDGTLVELAPTPDSVAVPDELLSLLARLQLALGGRVALLSGRALADIQSRVQPVSLVIGGSHGAERRLADGELYAAPPTDGLEDAVAEFKRVEAANPGVVVERKPTGVALHYRAAPGAGAECVEVAERMAAVANMSVQLGKMVVELRHPEADKGRALERFMEEPPFAGTVPICLGDDLTDEHAFASARRLGGAGILVGPPRSTAATYRLDDVAAARRWLERACDELE